MEKTIELTIEIPDTEATESEIEAFIEFEYGFNGSIPMTNPLVSCAAEIQVTNIYIED